MFRALQSVRSLSTSVVNKQDLVQQAFIKKIREYAQKGGDLSSSDPAVKKALTDELNRLAAKFQLANSDVVGKLPTSFETPKVDSSVQQLLEALRRRSADVCPADAILRQLLPSIDMGAGPLVVELVAVFILTALLLNKYADWRRHQFIVTLSTFIGWYFSFIIIFVLPLDVAITFYNRCEVEHDRALNTTGLESSYCEQPGGYVPDAVLLCLMEDSILDCTNSYLVCMLLL
ncbi:hypothetical protein COOONC_11178 [Cooperia oncophora]